MLWVQLCGYVFGHFGRGEGGGLLHVKQFDEIRKLLYVVRHSLERSK